MTAKTKTKTRSQGKASYREEASGARQARPWPPGQQAAGAEAMRERILDAGEALFAEHGFDGVTVRQITRKANVDVALAHYYFGSKRGLFDTRVPAPRRDPQRIAAQIHRRLSDQSRPRRGHDRRGDLGLSRTGVWSAGPMAGGAGRTIWRLSRR